LSVLSKIVKGLKDPVSIVAYLRRFSLRFQSKEGQILSFYREQYSTIPPELLWEKLDAYWREYRHFREIKQIIGCDAPAFGRKRILDIGCGYTSVLNILPPADKYGIDLVIDGLKRSGFSLDGSITWCAGRGEELTFDQHSFDIVFCSNGLDHYSDPQAVVAEVKRVLKQNGYFIITVDVFEESAQGYRDKKHPHSFTKSSLYKMLSDFKVLFAERSSLNAQFSAYVNGRIMQDPLRKELIVVLQML
jgi:ubiquinone/menaquinone biosynthesis C-methylase UbiE